MKQVSTMLGDAEYDQFNLAVSKVNKSTYEFVKDSVLREIERVLADEKGPIIEQMVEALRERKWSLYQREEYSDRNHLAWLLTRFPRASDRDRREALSRFRIAQVVGRP